MASNTKAATPQKGQKLCKVIRVLTIAPIMAFVALSILFALQPAIFGGLVPYLLSVLFLTVLPVLGYPLQPLLPRFRDGGREAQRNLAIILAMVGYLAGILYAVAAHVPKTLLFIFLTYLFSGLGIVLFNKVFHIRASGHACGVAGPVALLFWFIGPWALLGLLALALVFWSSLKMQRHSLSQLLWGTAISVAAALFTGLAILR